MSSADSSVELSELTIYLYTPTPPPGDSNKSHNSALEYFGILGVQKTTTFSYSPSLMSFLAAPVLQPHGVSFLYHGQCYCLSLRCLPDVLFACQTSTYCPTCRSSIIPLLKFVCSLFLYFPILDIKKWSVPSSPKISVIISYITYNT